MILRFALSLFIFIVVGTPFLIFPRFFHFKFLFPLFNALYRFSSKFKVYDLTDFKFELDTPAIYASNHKCFVDFCFISSNLKRPYTIMIKKEMTYNIFFKFIAWRVKLIPVKREDTVSRAKALQRAIKLIKNKNTSLIIFPEGWYSGDKPIGEIYKGIYTMAKMTNAKIVPIAIYACDNSFLDEKKLKWKNAYIKGGKPIYYKDYKNIKSFLTDLESRISLLYNEIEEELKN